MTRRAKIITKAESGVENCRGSRAKFFKRQLKRRRVGFIGPDLLGGDDGIKGYAELRDRRRNEIIIDIRNNPQLRATFESLQSAGNLYERFLSGQSVS